MHPSEGLIGSAAWQDLLQQCTEEDDSYRVELRTPNDFPPLFFYVDTGLSRMFNAGAHSYQRVRFMIIFIT